MNTRKLAKSMLTASSLAFLLGTSAVAFASTEAPKGEEMKSEVKTEAPVMVEQATKEGVKEEGGKTEATHEKMEEKAAPEHHKKCEKGEKAVDEKGIDEKTVGEKGVGEKAVDEKAVGDKGVGEKKSDEAPKTEMPDGKVESK